jgi:hypothetical protein
VLGGGIGGVSVAHEPKQAVGNEDRTTLVSNKPFFQFTRFNPRVAVKWRSNAILVTGAPPAGIEAGCGVANIDSTAALHFRNGAIAPHRACVSHFRFASDSGRTLAVHSSKIQPAARNVRSRIIKRVSPRAHILIAPALKSPAPRH